MSALNDVIEAFGGVRWQPASEAIKAIRASTGCDENNAVGALRVWISDGRVSVKGGILGALALATDLPADGPMVQFSLTFLQIDMSELHALLTKSGIECLSSPAPRLRPQLDQVIEILRDSYPSGRAHPSRKIILEEVITKLGRRVSPQTIDRARNTLWPKR